MQGRLSVRNVSFLNNSIPRTQVDELLASEPRLLIHLHLRVCMASSLRLVFPGAGLPVLLPPGLAWRLAVGLEACEGAVREAALGALVPALLPAAHPARRSHRARVHTPLAASIWLHFTLLCCHIASSYATCAVYQPQHKKALSNWLSNTLFFLAHASLSLQLFCPPVSLQPRLPTQL